MLRNLADSSPPAAARPLTSVRVQRSTLGRLARRSALVSLLLCAVTACHFEARVGTGDDAKAQESKKAKPKEADAATQPEKAKPAKTKKAPAAAEPAAVEVNKDSVVLPGNLVFDQGQSTLKEGSGGEEVLGSLKTFLDQQPRVTLLRIEGHSDNSAASADNLKISGERALYIKNWLIAQGISGDRLIAVGFGDQKPIADNATQEGRAQNRRVEFKIAKVDGKNYLGGDPLGGGIEFK